VSNNDDPDHQDQEDEVATHRMKGTMKIRRVTRRRRQNRG
jgi:hypothetical protein